jgi:hypothetical protein
MAALPPTPTDLQVQFTAEREYIQNFVDILQQRAVVSAQEVINLFHVLDENGFIDNKANLKIDPNSYTPNNLQYLYDFLQDIKPKLKQAIVSIESAFDKLDEPEALRGTDVRSVEGECIQFMLDALDRENPESEIEYAQTELRDQLIEQLNSDENGNE